MLCVLALIFLLVQCCSMHSTVTFSQMISCLFVWLYMYCCAIVLVLILDCSFVFHDSLFERSLSLSYVNTSTFTWDGIHNSFSLSFFLSGSLTFDSSLLKVWLVRNTTWRRYKDLNVLNYIIILTAFNCWITLIYISNYPT